MKKRNRRDRPRPKQSYWTRLRIIAILIVAIALCIASYLIIKQYGSEPEIEAYIRSQVTEKDLVPGFEPGAIYFKHPGMTSEIFCCVGTIFRDTNHGVQIATAEHIFRTDIRVPQTLTVKALRGHMDPPVTYITQILATGRDLGGLNHEERDIVVASLGTKPITIQPYSGFVESEFGQNFWGDVLIGKTKIPRLRSLLSGEYVDTLGYSRRGEGTNGAVFVIINRHVRRGESGTGYVDDYGGLWVVHAGTDNKEEEGQICQEGRRLTGRNDIKGVATVSGPLFGHYE